ncbi:MAG TPA: hypothetical protein VFA66_13300 [Gaiellaceae bacterium]|nr:hypothetical protein [Gaiellaceae bacterium]
MSAEGRASGRAHLVVTIGIAVTTVAVALVGFLEVRANSRSDEAAQTAQQRSVQTMASLLKAQEQTKVNYEQFLRAEEQRTQAGSAFQESVFAPAGEKELLRLVQERWQRLASKSERLTPIGPNSEDGPNRDRRFPRAMFSRASADANRYQALQDVANHENSAWEARATKFTAILTLLAVALYLFGFALAVPRRVLTLFGTAGAALLVTGIAWAGAVAASPPASIPDSAATEYSQGEVALETSTIGFDAAGFRDSIAHFTRAIDEWPGLARAYLGRANARLSSAPQVQASLIPPNDLKTVISDLDRAVDLGLESGLVYEQLAGSEFSLALHGQPDLYGHAAAHARKAIEIVPRDPVARYSLAISLLGAGDVDGAEAAYRDAIQATIANGEPQVEEQWVAGAMSDFEALRGARPDLGSAIDRMKEFVVGSVAAGSVVEPHGAASFPAVQAQVTPTSVAWASPGETGYTPGSDVLSVQWYARAAGNPWIGLPEVSGPVDPRAEPGLPHYSARNLTSSSTPPRCLGGGDYRVELYVNGHLAGSAQASVGYGSLRASIDRALNLEVCRPEDWQFSKHDLPGFRQGFVSRDGSRGVYLVRYDLSLLPARLRELPTSQLTEALLDSTASTSAFLLPGGKLTGRTAVQHQPSLGLPGSTQRSYGYAGGLAYGQCAIDEQDKAALVTFVFGPQTAFAQPGGSLIPVVLSLSEYRSGG